MKNIKKFVLSLFVMSIISFIIGCHFQPVIYANNKVNNKSNSTTQYNYSSTLEKVVIVKHVDGDTTKVKFTNDSINGAYRNKTEYIRFIGVNTPETVKPNTPVQPYGKEASNFTHSKLSEGSTIYLEKDAGDTDKYGRLLRYVWLQKPNNNSTIEIKSKMLNAILLQKGYAQLMTIQPNVKYIDCFTQLQKEARNNNLGLWSLDYYKSK